jgi:hypothetical protein
MSRRKEKKLGRIKEKFIDKLMKTFDRPCKDNKFYKKIVPKETTAQAIAVNDGESGCAITKIHFWETEPQDLIEGTVNKDDPFIIEENPDYPIIKNDIWGGENRKDEYIRYSKQKYKIQEKLMMIYDKDDLRNRKKTIKGNLQGLWLTDKNVKKMDTEIKKLITALTAEQKNSKLLKSVKNSDDEDFITLNPDKYVICSQKPINDQIDKVFVDIWNGYVKISQKLTEWLKFLIGNDYDTIIINGTTNGKKQNKNKNKNRMLNYLFQSEVCKEVSNVQSSSLCYHFLEDFNSEDSKEFKKINLGARILDILKDEKKVRIYDLNSAGEQVDPILMYDKDAGSYPDFSFFTFNSEENAGNSIKYTVGDNVIIKITFSEHKANSAKFYPKTNIVFTITLDENGIVTSTKREGIRNTGGPRDPLTNKAPLLVNEAGKLKFGVAYVNNGRTEKFLGDDDYGREDFKKAMKNAEKPKAKKAPKTKKATKKKTSLFHNETILYAQPVERHYSPMERVSRGMDKVELEDVTFKF